MQESNYHKYGHGGEADNIAISLSGGGVRAVGFHLGTLEMLETLGLLRKVSILSSVSGGSLTGTGYALSQHIGQPFDVFFRNLYDFLPNLNTVEELLAGLARKETPSPSGRRDLITVLANIYDGYYRQYFPEVSNGGADSPRFNILLDDGTPGSHLKEIAFNATEFQTGTAFRFQRSEHPCLIGNGNIFLCERHARDIRMTDIMAASSCIPAGMEPLFFPHDFHWSDDGQGSGDERPTFDEIRESLRSNLSRKFRQFSGQEVEFFALMDGGVYDNQGIVSLLLALNRQARDEDKEKGASDICVCGMSNYEDSEPPGPQDWAKWFAGESAQGSDDLKGALEDVGTSGVDLIIISDTPVLKDSQYPKIGQSATRIEPLPAQRPDRKKSALGGLTIGGVDRIGWGVTILLMISAAVTFYQEIWPGRKYQTQDLSSMVDDILLVIIPLLVVISLAVILKAIRTSLRGIADKIYEVLPPNRWGKRKPWYYIKKLRLRDLFDMLSLRAGSVTALTASIFMNRIRALSYSAAYTRDETASHILPNQIFELEILIAGKQDVLPEGLVDLIQMPSKEMSGIISLAAHMPTKLWINDIDDSVSQDNSGPFAAAKATVAQLNASRRKMPLDDFDVLVISGQLTICYNLMLHLWRSHRDDDGWMDDAAEALFEKTRELWNRAAIEPTVHLDERKKAAGFASE